ncbi:DUF1826 domain-containing protein [Idiomarina aminovorans]|uniref:DUF1826 domain-containing protein n=1 Tax=Idiomarina aminovorans TaxID=2914829 RepID=UPI00200436ED|nr:DUF1826 domain-containing protein [Idiomarina sp. ATCH4]MCK7460349.1 DUF1826 domain-containing protein [Idiomarina sp. ATCH4]
MNTLIEDINQPDSAALGERASVLTDIYDDKKNIAVWRRSLPETLETYFDRTLEQQKLVNVAREIGAGSMVSDIGYALSRFPENTQFSQHVEELVDMFSCLFDLSRVGLRIRTLDTAMCPKFHVDRVPCRLVTTFSGSGTQWLPHESVDRSGGHFEPIERLIRNLNCGDVGLLKGELWQGNENRGLVHRSPTLATGENQRLLLTLDFL